MASAREDSTRPGGPLVDSATMTRRFHPLAIAIAAAGAATLGLASLGAQDRLKAMPGYDQFTKMQGADSRIVGLGRDRRHVGRRRQELHVCDRGQALQVRRRHHEARGNRRCAGHWRQRTRWTRRARRGRTAGDGRDAARTGTDPAGPGPWWPRRTAHDAPRRHRPQRRHGAGAVRDADDAVSPAVRRGGRARTSGRLRRLARRQAQGVLSRSQSLGRQLRRHRTRSRSRPTAAEASASSTAPAAGSTARSSAQTTAIWWSPDSTKVGFYRFDESQVKDFYLQMNQTAGAGHARHRGVSESRRAESDRRRVRLRHRGARKTTKIDVRDGKPFANDVVGHYVYDVRWSPDGTELLDEPHESPAADHGVGGVQPGDRQVPRRSSTRNGRPAGSSNRAARCALLDGQQALHLGIGAQRLARTTTSTISPASCSIRSRRNATFEAGAHREARRSRTSVLFYMARDGDNYMKLQLHRVGLDGKGDVRLTDPKFNHSVDVRAWPAAAARPRRRRRRGGGAPASCGISPDNKYFVDVYQTHDHAAGDAARRRDDGKVVAQLAKSDTTKFDAARPQEGGAVHLQGRRRQDDALRADSVSVELRSVEEVSDAGVGVRRPGVGQQRADGNLRRRRARTAEYGFLMSEPQRRARRPAWASARSTRSTCKLGMTEMDDMAEGIKALWIASVLRQGPRRHLRHVVRRLHVGDDDPAASRSRSPPRRRRRRRPTGTTTTRSTPSATCGFRRRTRTGYDAGSDDDLRDEPQGPAAALLRHRRQQRASEQHRCSSIKALQQRGKSFEVQVGPDQGHTRREQRSA